MCSSDLPTPPQALHELALQRVLSNLIDNALRHAGGTAIVLRTRAETNPASGQGIAILEVIDSGPGIAPALTERLKLPFVRLQDSRTGPAGAGLGLAIVERILRQHKQLNTASKRILEINGDHPVIRRLGESIGKDGAAERIAEAAHLLLDQARLLEGETVPDMAAFARRLTSALGRGLAS